VAILMYHSIGNDNRFSTVSLAEFSWQMNYLHSSGFSVISLNQLVSNILNHRTISSKTVVLTFDDGYANNYTAVLSILKKYNYLATVFLTTGWIGRKARFHSHTFSILDWIKIREMYDSGLVNFEPHTHTHPKLAEINLSVARQEMALSKKIIEEKLGKICNIIAYPFGSFNSTIKEMAKESFVAAVSVKKGYVDLATWKEDLYALPRQSIDSMVSRFRFKLKV
jgi:peptidoglycan/xylan/chitin deacetylase (PgdA/CDA1 family)